MQEFTLIVYFLQTYLNLSEYLIIISNVYNHLVQHTLSYYKKKFPEGDSKDINNKFRTQYFLDIMRS